MAAKAHPELHMVKAVQKAYPELDTVGTAQKARLELDMAEAAKTRHCKSCDLFINGGSLCELCDSSEESLIPEFPFHFLCLTCGLPTDWDETKRENDLITLFCRDCYSVFVARGEYETDDSEDSDMLEAEDEGVPFNTFSSLGLPWIHV